MRIRSGPWPATGCSGTLRRPTSPARMVGGAWPPSDMSLPADVRSPRTAPLREVGTLPKGHDIKVLEDHLLGLGMTTRVDDRPEGWAVWVYNEDHFPQARQELEAFRENPKDPRYKAASDEAARVRREKEQAEKQYRKNVVDMSQRWGRVPWRRRPLTMALLIVCGAVYRADPGPFRRRPARIRDVPAHAPSRPPRPRALGPAWKPSGEGRSGGWSRRSSSTSAPSTCSAT